MKIRLLSILIFFAALSSIGYSVTRANTANLEINEHLDHAPMNHAGNSHSHHPESESQVTTQAKLTVSSTLSPNQVTNLGIKLQDSSGEAVKEFDVFQEKLMHLIVVSDDLEFFNHLHPTYQGNGYFEIETTFPKPGNYTLYADYKPTGQSEQISVLQTTVSTREATPLKSLNTKTEKTFGQTKVNLELNPKIQAGETATVTFNLTDAETNQSVTNLQPYLGERGHLVIIKQSDSLSQSSYLHAHALERTEENEVAFQTQFPEPGNYKLWGQFNRNGKIVTADFWVSVP